MEIPATLIKLSPKAAQGIIQYSYQCYQLLNQQWNIREQLRQVDLSYMRENDFTTAQWRARTANAYGDPTKYQNITYPIVQPQIETAVAYQASVFLTGEPIIGCVAPPEYEDEALMMQTTISDQARVGKWKREFLMFFKNAFKYNLAAMECDWDYCVTPAFETDLNFAEGLQGKPKEILWQGNICKNWDMYNTFFDTRVPASEICTRGEFAGRTWLMGRTELKGFINRLGGSISPETVIAAFNSSFGGFQAGGFAEGGIQSFYLPSINPGALISRNIYSTMDWLAWAGITGGDKASKIQYKNIYEITKLYARIIPSDFGISVPEANWPQVWKFYIVNHQVVLYAERLTNAHDMIPVFFCQPNEDGLWYQTKSDAQNVQPFQALATARANSAVAGWRRSISDRILYDPSRISSKDINSDNPIARIPVRPSAFGTEVSKSIHVFPFDDKNAANAFQEIQMIGMMADQVSGHNKAQQGQFVKGNKTMHEYDSVMGRANAKDQVKAILIQEQVFTPLKFVIKTNNLQYQPGTSLYSQDAGKMVDIDPVKMRKAAMEFKMSDGLTPSDKLINAETAQVGLQTIQSVPEIGKSYDVGELFSYIMKTQGAENLDDFKKPKERVAYEDAVNAWRGAAAGMKDAIKEVMAAATEQPLEDLLKVVQGMLPPQPKPEDFGYYPNGKKPQQTNPVTGV